MIFLFEKMSDSTKLFPLDTQLNQLQSNIDYYFFNESKKLLSNSVVILDSATSVNALIRYIEASLAADKDVLLCDSSVMLDRFTGKIRSKRIYISDDGWIYFAARAKRFFQANKIQASNKASYRMFRDMLQEFSDKF